MIATKYYDTFGRVYFVMRLGRDRFPRRVNADDPAFILGLEDASNGSAFHTDYEKFALRDKVTYELGRQYYFGYIDQKLKDNVVNQ